MSLHSEILEQPQRLRELLASQRGAVEKAAEAIRERDSRYVFLTARGTSDNAGRYANYLLGGVNGFPVALATPSLFTFYKTPPKLTDALVIAISQSGRSPDIISVLAEARRQGCLTLALTNEPESQLAHSADLVLDLQVGAERAVAATKTYTAELMLLAMLSASLKKEEAAWSELEHVAGWADEVLELDMHIAQSVQRYRYMNQTVVLGRGYNYSTAFEWAIKLKELTYIGAEAYSSADFLHGPIAIVQGGFPVLAVAPSGAVFDSMLEMMQKLKGELKAELVVISDHPAALQLAEVALPLPQGIPEWLSPIPAIVAGQLFACHLTRIKGYDTEQPRTIRKVTETE
jgi:glucosamine--fructose-6-phosphate aminotransferase (isomerizing)